MVGKYSLIRARKDSQLLWTRYFLDGVGLVVLHNQGASP
jgi:hypothetical protein